ncbi:hypothetical protein BDZ94DRAFT_1301816 [Collybia nuda]|uniref:Uncharacterized protein n=1 Tax=Collybia nuda TaxID=64659 RepID=A0A9P5XXP4_9AGAR|nr:hypothetical protein BDZ94DRAFT_1301816 [Collybia nuda]
MSIDKGSHIIKPNPHPYAIKTTSTALLSRSASIPSSTTSTPYYYVPSSPSPSPTKTHAPRPSRHRYSRSLTSNDPRPLPVPPGDALPPVFNSPQGPKQWTPEQLAEFLEEKIPGEEVRQLVIRHEIGGRAFLRFDDGVLDAYSVPKTLRPALLSAVRSLKQRVLHGRINPFSTDNTTSRQSISRSASSSPTRPITNPRFSSSCTHDPEEDDPAYLSSSSSFSSVSSTSSLRNLGNGDPDGSSHRRRRTRRDGRVHGIVASLERSGSVDEGHSPTRSQQGSPTRALNSSPTRFSTSPTRGLYTRDPSDSTSNNSTDDEPGDYFSGYGLSTSRYDPRGRPLPFPPAEHQLQFAPTPGSPSKDPPLLLPRKGMPLASPQHTGGSFGSMENTPQHTGASVGGRPLPLPPNGGFIPIPLEDGSVFGSEKSVYESARSSPTGSTTSSHSGVRMSRGRRKDNADRGSEEEMSVDDILASLGTGGEKLPLELSAVGENETYKADRTGIGEGPKVGLVRRGRVRKPSSQVSMRGGDEEMTMEELLAIEGDGKGAEAWEMDLTMGETVKRVPGGGGKEELKTSPDGAGSVKSPYSELGELSGSVQVVADTVKPSPSSPSLEMISTPPVASLRPRTLATGSMRLSEPIPISQFSPTSISKGTQDRLSMPGSAERLSMTSRTRGRKLKVKEGRDRRGVVDVFGHEVDLLGSSQGTTSEDGQPQTPVEDKLRSPSREEKSLPLPPQEEAPIIDLSPILDQRNSEVEALKQEVGALKEELVMLKEENGMLREETVTLKMELGTTQGELGTAQANAVESHSEIATLRADLVASKSVVTALEAEVAATRGVAEALRTRTAEMEERIRVSEDARAKANETPAVEDTDESLRVKVFKNLKMLALAWSISIPGLNGLFSTTANISSGANGRNRRRQDVYDPRQAPFPRYVLLVGIGMCAFMLRGIVRRVLGLGGGGVGALGGRAVRGVGGVGVRRL